MRSDEQASLFNTAITLSAYVCCTLTQLLCRSINRGCFPKKLLMYGTQFSEALIAAPNVGWDLDTENASLQWGRLMQQKVTIQPSQHASIVLKHQST